MKIQKKIKDNLGRLLGVAVVIALIVIVAVSGGEKKKETVKFDYDPETTPTMVTDDVSTLISDSGYVRYQINTDIWLMFNEAQQPNWKFPNGLYLEKFDDSMVVNATFRCDSALYLTNEKLWQFNGNVRMINDAGDRFLTQQLFWDQGDHKLRSDSFIHIERSDRIIEGYGFESNENITNYRVHRPSMILPMSDFNRHKNDSIEENTPNTDEPQDTKAGQSTSTAPKRELALPANRLQPDPEVTKR